MATGDFDLYYTDNPWSSISSNKRAWYVPDLLDTFRMRNVYRPFIQFAVRMDGPPAETMYYTELFDTEPDVTALNNRALWMASQHMDTQQLAITCEHHGDKLAMHKYDSMVTYWRQNGREGLRPILRNALGQNISDYYDLLARNAFGNAHFVYFAGGTITAQDDSGFAYLTSSDTYDPDEAMKVWLKAQLNDVPMLNDPNGFGGAIPAITTPGVVYDIQAATTTNSFWKSVQMYNNTPPVSQYEVGQYKQARYLSTRRNILYNCGPVTAQTTLNADVTAGDGATASTVRGAYTVGGTTGATNYITVTSSAGFSAGDIVSIHATREADGRAKWDDPKKIERTIYAVVDGTKLAFEKPILWDLTASDTWYITLGLNVHMTVFPVGPRGIVAGVTMPPQIHTPPPVDDFEAMYRLSWDTYTKYQLFRPEHTYVIFSAATDDWN